MRGAERVGTQQKDRFHRQQNYDGPCRGHRTAQPSVIRQQWGSAVSERNRLSLIPRTYEWQDVEGSRGPELEKGRTTSNFPKDQQRTGRT
ncbi:hypothetical protein NSPZN2_10979 [Nitrospira defluvii]|uniref:Uncharacterized protein n=1 Tax=Nitrospira defluvii TaxID=330214 RepID=A0ABM8QN11_9BACT|nr:hypothetical protein NSPZN2_10979 [Nitrospira defluvii]